MIAYLVTNLINGKQYVGITKGKLEHRWRMHRTDSKRSGKALHLAIQKYGVENFTIIQIASAIGSIDNLKQLEKDLIEQYETFSKGYNLTLGGDGVSGYKVTDKEKQKLSGFRKKELGSESHSFKGTILAINKEMCVAIEMNGAQEIKDAGFLTGCVYKCVSGKRKTHQNFTFKRI